jgi:hypothetical protein
VVNTSIAVCIMSHFGTLIPPGSWYRQRGSKYCLHDWQMPLQVNRGAKRLRSRARQPLPPPPPTCRSTKCPASCPRTGIPAWRPAGAYNSRPAAPHMARAATMASSLPHHGLHLIPTLPYPPLTSPWPPPSRCWRPLRWPSRTRWAGSSTCPALRWRPPWQSRSTRTARGAHSLMSPLRPACPAAGRLGAVHAALLRSARALAKLRRTPRNPTSAGRPHHDQRVRPARPTATLTGAAQARAEGSASASRGAWLRFSGVWLRFGSRLVLRVDHEQVEAADAHALGHVQHLLLQQVLRGRGPRSASAPAPGRGQNS